MRSVQCKPNARHRLGVESEVRSMGEERVELRKPGCKRSLEMILENLWGRSGFTFAALIGLSFTIVAVAQEPKLSPETQQSIDRIAKQSLIQMGAPSASVAVVKDG